MMIDRMMVFVILALLGQSILSSLPKFYWGTILPIISSIMYLYTVDGTYFTMLELQTGIFMVTRAVVAIVRAIKGKKKRSEIDKSIIKDL